MISTVSDHERQGLGGCHAGLVSVHMLGGCRGSGPRSRMVSYHKRRGLAKGLVSHGLPIMSALGRSPTVSDHERQGLGGCHGWVRGLPWSLVMSTVGLGRCRAIRVRGLPCSPVQTWDGLARWVRGLPWSPVMTAMILGGCHEFKS